jgi:phage terminase small subunit
LRGVGNGEEGQGGSSNVQAQPELLHDPGNGYCAGPSNGTAPRTRGPGHLNARQQRFVEEYLIDLNATAAYRRAGYKSGGTAARAGAAQILANTSVADAIAQAKARRSARTQVRYDDVIRELARIGFSSIADFISWDAEGRITAVPSEELDADKTAAILNVKATLGRKGEALGLEIRLHNKIQALGLLLRHLGDMPEEEPEVAQAGLARLLLGTLEAERRKNGRNHRR